MADLSTRFRGLDQIPVPDLRTDIAERRDREVEVLRVPAGPSPRRRALAAGLALAVFAAAGFLAWRAFTPGTERHQGAAAQHTYRDPLGWTLQVPSGWHALRFDVLDPSGTIRFRGVQLSNVVLPAPTVSGDPPVPTAGSLPSDGVAVIVSRAQSNQSIVPFTDEIPLPLSLDAFPYRSARGGVALRGAAFAAGGWTFSTTVQRGTGATDPAELRAVRRTLASFRFDQPSALACAGSDLSARLAGSEGAAGTIYVAVHLTNTSGATCSLEGPPNVELLNAAGDPLAIQTRPGLPQGPSLEPSTVVLEPGQGASVVVAFSDVVQDPYPCQRAVTVRIVLTSGDAIEVPLDAPIDVCGPSVWAAPFTAAAFSATPGP